MSVTLWATPQRAAACVVSPVLGTLIVLCGILPWMTHGHPCWIGQEPDLASNHLRWALPTAEDTGCHCTAVKLGGVNLIQPRRPLCVKHFDAPLGLRAAKKAFNCTTRVCMAEAPLGMADGRIPDDHITASSQYNWVDHAPWKARLIANGKNAWCFKQSEDSAPWIQVDFSRDLYVTGLVTQGRELYDQYVKSYRVEMSGDGRVWQAVTGEDGAAIEFAGNTDSIHLATTSFGRVLRTRFLRVLPEEWNKSCCLRFEVMGCNCTELKP